MQRFTGSRKWAIPVWRPASEALSTTDFFLPSRALATRRPRLADLHEEGKRGPGHEPRNCQLTAPVRPPILSAVTAARFLATVARTWDSAPLRRHKLRLRRPAPVPLSTSGDAT